MKLASKLLDVGCNYEEQSIDCKSYISKDFEGCK